MQKYIHNKKRFSDKSVLIKQVIGEEPAAEENEIIYAMSPLGEFLTQERDSDTDSYNPQPQNGQKKKERE